MEAPKRINYIFVDFENTQAVDVSLLAGKAAILLLVVGDKQKNLPVTLVKQLLAHADQVGVVEAGCTGKNALDFVLAFHVGQWAKQDPTGYFHIVSRDKGFDALITHLRQLKVSAARHDEFTQIPLFINHQQTTTGDKIAFLTERLSIPGASRPAKRAKLISYVTATFSRQLAENEVLGLVHDMEQRKLITISEDNKVTYSL
jgi:hypothetical protein